ncbi:MULTISPECIES: GGDEF domain-containing protein [Cocleimonas]|uniref:diguanylate cyclase n=1 Tax=Cocleimonas flava TaxID=634765 RepID=A0A4R1F3T9_9GAMM|nr:MULTISPECIES: GGDEF domain-containing protein [Cocleimonas]TCJ88473.1 diguanylate cyclase (GGDEF)-like protein [Cocleimonas flava]
MFKSFKCGSRSLEEQFVLYGAGLTFIFLVPFSIYRFFTGDLTLAAIDMVMALLMVLIFTQAWQSKKIKYLNRFSVLMFMLGILSVMYLKGAETVFWAFPAMGATYFLLKSVPALIANIIFIGLTTLLFHGKLTNAEAMSIYPSLALVGLFGFILSMRAEYNNNKLQKLVSEDTLTGIKNRRSFDEKVDEIIRNYRRYRTPVSMLLLDLDQFKKINDTKGHNAGDQVLVDFAKLVKSKIRTTDFIYRFGGEEFVVLAKNSSLEDSGNLADSIRKFIKESAELSKHQVTVSVGVSEIMPFDDAESWFRRADLALYESKSAGRDTVRIAETGDDTKVSFKALSNYQNIKPLRKKANYLICPYKNTHSSLLKDNPRKNKSFKAGAVKRKLPTNSPVKPSAKSLARH